MTTEVLRYCLDIVRTKSFTKAAEINHISQQAMSQQVKNLEWELGIKLFDRSNRSLEVTAAGEVYLKGVEEALQQLDSALLSAKAFSSGKSGTLSLGYNGPSAQRYLSRALEKFNEEYPDVEVNLSTGTNQEIQEKFSRDLFDLIAVGDFCVFDTSKYHVIQWESGLIDAVVGKRHPFAQRESVSPEELLEETYISLDLKDPAMQERSWSRCAELLGELPKKIKLYEKTETLDVVVASGAGFTLLNSDLNGYYKDSMLTFVPIKGANTVHSSRFVWRKDNRNPVLRHFLEVANSIGFMEVEDVKFN